MSQIYKERGRIVPIVGENCFVCELTDEEIKKFKLSKDDDEPVTLPLLEYLILCRLYLRSIYLNQLKETIAELDGVVECSDERLQETLTFMRRNPYQGISMLKEAGIIKHTPIEYLKIIENAGDRIKLDETVRRFLETYQFELIITTNIFDDIFELTGYNIERYNYDNVGEKKEYKLENKTIYCLFNCCGKGGAYVDDEEQLLRFLDFLHDKDTRPQSLMSYFSTDRHDAKLLLILDSTLPDWVFRFTCQPLMTKETKGFVYGKQAELCDKRFLAAFSSKHDRMLKVHLNELIDEFHRESGTIEKKKHDKTYDIFISHRGEDTDLAIEIKKYLDSKGLNAYCDTDRIKGGDNYVTKMKTGIENSAYFLILITPNLFEGAKNLWVMSEELNSDPDKMVDAAKKQEIPWFQFELLYANYIRQERGQKTFIIPMIFKKELERHYAMGVPLNLAENVDLPFKVNFPTGMLQSISSIDYAEYKTHDWSRYQIDPTELTD